MAVDDELLRLALPFTGEPSAVRDVSWDLGESAVWRVEGPRGVVALKAHRQRRKLEQELTAYRDWLPALATGPAGVLTPRLLAAREEHPRALVVTWLPGVVMEKAAPTRAEEVEAHRRAGGFLASLHALPHVDGDPVPLAEAYERRLVAWVERARGAVAESCVADVQAAVREALPVLANERRAPCHRDYSPRNWFLLEGGGLGVIDLEHARPDLRVLDLERLWCGAWRREPGLREAFMEGYGRELADDEEGTLRRLSALSALATVVWAHEHRDEALAAHGRDVLRWLGLSV